MNPYPKWVVNDWQLHVKKLKKGTGVQTLLVVKNNKPLPIIMETHIGNLVSAKMQEMHISIKTLSERLNMSRMNVHDILKRKTMQTDLLAQIGKAMNYDFFQHYSVTAEEVQKTKSELYEEP